MPLADNVKEFLQTIGEIITKETADVLSTVISKDVTISIGEMGDLDQDAIKAALPTPILMVQFSYSTHPEDVVYIVVEQSLAVKIASWMMMDGEENAEFSDMHLDSIKETAGQLLGQLTPVLAEPIGREIPFGSIRAEVVELSDDTFAVPEPVQILYTITMGEGNKHQVVEVLSNSAVDRFLQGPEEESEGEGEEDDMGMGEEAAAGEMTEEGEGGDDFDMGDVVGGDAGDMAAATEVSPAPIPAGSDVAIPEMPGVEPEKVEMLLDISLPISIELGRTKMLIKDILELGHGSVIEFDKLAGEPVDLMINDKKVAEGEVVVIEEHFGIRLTNLITPSERIKRLG